MSEEKKLWLPKGWDAAPKPTGVNSPFQAIAALRQRDPTQEDLDRINRGELRVGDGVMWKAGKRPDGTTCRYDYVVSAVNADGTVSIRGYGIVLGQTDNIKPELLMSSWDKEVWC